jgi:hypothetical protein
MLRIVRLAHVFQLCVTLCTAPTGFRELVTSVGCQGAPRLATWGACFVRGRWRRLAKQAAPEPVISGALRFETFA